MKDNPVFFALKMMTISAVIFGIVAFSMMLKKDYGELNRLKKNAQWEDTTYLWKRGGTSTFGPNGFDNPMIDYNLRSWDGGKNWYLVNTDSNQFRIVGLVDTIYPGLIEHLESWDRMTNYVTKNGPIKLNDPEGLKVLNDAGFTVKTNSNK
jgi:hypothetical protein